MEPLICPIHGESKIGFLCSHLHDAFLGHKPKITGGCCVGFVLENQEILLCWLCPDCSRNRPRSMRSGKWRGIQDDWPKIVPLCYRCISKFFNPPEVLYERYFKDLDG